MRRAIGIALTVAAAALAGCGSSSSTISNATATGTKISSGTKEFRAAGFKLRFHYPAYFHVIHLQSVRQVGHTKNASAAAVGLGPLDLIGVTLYPHLAVAVTNSNLVAVRPQFDALITSLLGHRLTGTVDTSAPAPTLVYPAVRLPDRAIRVIVIFIGSQEYEVQCSSTSAHAAAIAGACREMLSTFSAVGSS